MFIHYTIYCLSVAYKNIKRNYLRLMILYSLVSPSSWDPALLQSLAHEVSKNRNLS